ncbi:uncharacterized protein EMH_0086460 [Eimeria mitis]|uniref:Vacuolar protein sorting-associated protein 13 DH-like domain-containing protein n=1 Tax=Eimeria mitis TaxID=44415 RepID=U6JPM5_9EIME|nr:uncharacterized protein EMH_0086460 [Eimeria mitis]CDJ27455.1 hypothetical protein EMH_0086460 [Eimeria mitis]
MVNPQHKRYEVLLGMEGVADIIVTSEKIGDDTVIAVLSKDVKLNKQLTLAQQQQQTQAAQEDVKMECSFASFDLAVKLQEIGVSLICDNLAEELCYASLFQVAVGLQQRGDREKIVVRIEKVQVDNQMENGNKPVVFANRGGKDLPTHEPKSWVGAPGAPGAPPRSSPPFLTVFLVRLNSGSRDVVLKRALVEMDDLEIDIDADMLNGLNEFVWSCLIAFRLADAASRRAVSLEEFGVWVNEPVALHYMPPPLPTILSLESLVISRFRVYCWCSFVLDKMHMISDLLKLGLRILMASGRLELTVRQSSLLNLPRMPYEFGRNTIGLAANAVDSVSTGEGVWALSSIVTKPIEGAQKEGVGGFLKGIGKGLMGSLVKPLDRVGQAVSDVTRGIHAEVTKPIGALKRISTRHRQPRMIGEQGEVRPYDETEAQLRQSLGLAVLRPMQKCMTVLRQETPEPCQLAVLFYPQDIFLVSIKGGDTQKELTLQGSQTQQRARGSSSSVQILWHVSVAAIREVKTDSRGVTLTVSPQEMQLNDPALGRASSLRRLARDPGGRYSSQPTTAAAATTTGTTHPQTYLIPCQDAVRANEVYRELLETQRGCATVVHLGINRRLSEADT